MAGTERNGPANLKELVQQTTADRSYYFGRISREDANDVLMNHTRDGSFLLRMSATKQGVYTISLTQGHAVRHIRILNVPHPEKTGAVAYVLSEGDDPCLTVWDLIKQQMNTTLTNSFNFRDAVMLRYPVQCDEDVIAPDLLEAAEECGMERGDFGEDVAKFLEGGVAASRLARSRSTKHTSISGVSEQELDEFIRQGLIDEDFASILEQFMKGKLSAEEFQAIRKSRPTPTPAKRKKGGKKR